MEGLPSYDALLEFIDAIEQGELEKRGANLEEIEALIIDLARKGMLPGAEEENAEVEHDIQELIDNRLYENCSFFSTSAHWVIVPAFFDSQREIMLCKNWWTRSWKGVTKFVKKHKKVIIVGVATVLAVTVGVLLVREMAKENNPPAPSTAAPELVSHPSPTPSSSLLDRQSPLLKEIVEEQVLVCKETIVEEQLEELSESSLKKTAREAGSKLAHGLLSVVSEFTSVCAECAQGVQSGLDATGWLLDKVGMGPPEGHEIPEEFFSNPKENHDSVFTSLREGVDAVFGTDYAKNYTLEAQAIKNTIVHGALPPPIPGASLGKITAFLREGERAVALGEQLGFTRKEITHLKSTGELEKTVAGTFEKVVSDPASHASYERIKRAEVFLESHSKQFRPETQVRELIHQTGMPTFPRPVGIPENFRVKISQRGGGMRYVHPKDEGTSIRIMPGKPHSPFPHQREPYVIQLKNGQAIDKYGNRVSPKSPDAHIPINEFKYRE
ncbi:MAG: hypothetical protein JSR80_02840 [Verrucomicrobia bacterium]|nr:hypothetical protein [Verrucomicrobiota bacterium]